MKHSDQETLSRLMDGEWRDLDVRRSIVDVCGDDALRAKWARYHLVRDAMRHESIDAAGALAERVRAALADEPTHSNVTAIGAVADTGSEAALDAARRSVTPTREAGTAETRPVAERMAAEQGAAEQGAAGETTAAVNRLGGTRQAGAARRADGGGSGMPRGAIAVPARGARTRTFAAGFGLAAGVALVTAVGLDAWRDGAGGAAPDANARIAATGGAEGVIGEEGAFSLQLPGAPLPRVELVSNTGAYWVAPESATRRADSEERLNMFLSQHLENSPTAERQGMLPYSRLVGYDERAPER